MAVQPLGSFIFMALKYVVLGNFCTKKNEKKNKLTPAEERKTLSMKYKEKISSSCRE